jgi:quinol monooxygenase YgiN
MFALAVRFDLRPVAGQGFDALVTELLPQVRAKEPGTLLYVCAKDVDEPELVRVFFEVYRDRESFEEHERQEHVKRFLAAREEFVESVRVEFVEPYDAKGLAVDAP